MRRGPAEKLFWVLAQPKMVALLTEADRNPGQSTGDMAAAVGISSGLASTLLSHLRRQDLLERSARKGALGNNSMWRPTSLGKDVLRHVASIREMLSLDDQD